MAASEDRRPARHARRLAPLEVIDAYLCLSFKARILREASELRAALDARAALRGPNACPQVEAFVGPIPACGQCQPLAVPSMRDRLVHVPPHRQVQAPLDSQP